jgi:hypothetical protein
LLLSALGCAPLHLYSSEAGFPRNSPIGVQPPPFAVPGLAEAMRYWNTTSGRLLFIEATDGPIRFRPAITAGQRICGEAIACAAPVGHDGQFRSPPAYPYRSCVVYLAQEAVTSPEVIAHELGHCLGFDHHTDGHRSIMSAPAEFAPDHDAAMLQAAGY